MANNAPPALALDPAAVGSVFGEDPRPTGVEIYGTVHRNKGDIGWDNLPPPRPLTKGPPFAKLTQGK